MEKIYTNLDAFKSLDALNEEESFNLNDRDVSQELDTFYKGDDVDDLEVIIDVDADTEEELKDSYVGNVIIECSTCKTKLYKEESEIVPSEEDDTIYNEEEECPHCHSTNGYTVIGKVAPYVAEEDEDEEPVDDDEDEEPVDDEEDEEDESNIEEGKNCKHCNNKKHTKRARLESKKRVPNVLKKKLVEKIVKNSRKKNLKESSNYYTIYNNLLDRAKSTIDDGYDIEDAVDNAINDGVIWYADILELAIAYKVLDYDKLLRDFYDDLYSDLAIDLEKYIGDYDDEDGDNIDEFKRLVEKPQLPLEPRYDGRKNFQVKKRVEEDAQTTTKSLKDLTKCDKCKGELDKDFKCPKCDGDKEVEIDLEEIDEKLFDSLATKYVNEIYENVKSYTTTKGKVDNAKNKLVLEGVIKFKSGKTKSTKFIFEGATITKRGKVKLHGLNESFSASKKAFVLQGTINRGKLISENLTYNYYTKGSLNESKKIYGRVNNHLTNK